MVGLNLTPHLLCQFPLGKRFSLSPSTRYPILLQALFQSISNFSVHRAMVLNLVILNPV